MKDKAIVLLSGGLDSATVLALVRGKYKKILALSFDYGQRHLIELKLAKKLALLYNCEHLIAKLDSSLFLGSSLVKKNKIPIPFATPYKKFTLSSKQKIPSTYVPARNTLFLAHALALAESHSCTEIYIGINAVDYSGYPDCRPKYLKAFNAMCKLATKSGVETLESKKGFKFFKPSVKKNIQVLAPLLYLSKKEIIKKGLALNLDYSLTNSCYQPSIKGIPCKKCESCKIREEAFRTLL